MIDAGQVQAEDILAAARASLAFEAEAISSLQARLNGQMVAVVQTILAHEGKVVVTGIGKSGLIGRKIAATLCSTGTPAVYLHSTEAVHGDLGIYAPGDPTIIICKSGATAELLRLVPILKDFHSPLIGILGNMNSPLARQVDMVLDGSVVHEADPLNLAPTSSTLVALAIGDAIAAALVRARGFTEDDYQILHPSGQLGKNLTRLVHEFMHPLDACAKNEKGDSIRQVVIGLTQHNLGASLVLDDDNSLLGIITDGDIRRAFQKEEAILEVKAAEIMTASPVVVAPDARIKYALDLMENRKSQLSVLPVVDDTNQCVGLLRLHDIYGSENGD